jgi:hypothetical protein
MKILELPKVGKFGKNKPKSRFLRSLRPIIFELQSQIGRLVYISKRLPQNNYLNVGCGPNVIESMDNMDFYQFNLRKSKIISHDIRFKFPFPDSAYSGIITEHTVEHITPHDAIKLFEEFYRITCPGAVVRIIVPDLEKYVNYYLNDLNGRNITDEFSVFDNGCEAIWNLTQNWEHISCWDYKMMKKCLLNVGFKSCEKKSFMIGDNIELLKDSPHRAWESLYIEAVH